MLGPADSGNRRHAKSLGKTYGFCKWTRPKSDPTMQMQFQVQMQVEIQMQMQFQCTCTCKCKCKGNFNAKVGPKLLPELHKIIKILWEMCVFFVNGRKQPSCTQSDSKVIPKCAKQPQKDSKTRRHHNRIFYSHLRRLC